MSLFLASHLITACSSFEDESATFRVMSFNIAAGHGDLDGIVQVIQEDDPDVVALQEVDVHWSERSDFVDQARYLGEALDMYYYLGEIYTFESDDKNAPPRQFGLGFLSKKDFVYQQNHQLTRLSTQVDPPQMMSLPGFPEIAIEINGQKIHIFNTHLDYRAEPNIRGKQTWEMLKILETVKEPVILMGDLNAESGAAEIGSLFERLEDAWLQIEEPGYTYPADQPDRRIDYILHSGDFRVKEASVLITEASDHRPVVAELVFMKKSG